MTDMEHANNIIKKLTETVKEANIFIKEQQKENECLRKMIKLDGDLYKDEIRKLKEKMWISVKERYPDKEGFYLVSADHGNYLPWIAEMKIFCGVKGFCNGATMPCVGAWMPLPEPYNRTD